MYDAINGKIIIQTKYIIVGDEGLRSIFGVQYFLCENIEIWFMKVLKTFLNINCLRILMNFKDIMIYCLLFKTRHLETKKSF